LAKHLERASLLATDLSPAALAVARQNAAQLGVGDRIEFREGDLLQPIADRAPFDMVVSNPPYIGQAERETLSPSVVRYEPELALFSTGSEGTEIIRRLMVQSRELLRPGGYLLFEISPLIAQRVRDIFSESSEWQDVAIKKDLAGHDRIVIARLSPAG
jgi:release factor glutamine methyltransferase